MLKRLCLRYKNLSAPVKASVWFTVCNLLLKGISLISVPLFTRLMTEQQYGMLSLFMSYQQIILVLSTWEISLYAYQKGIFKYKNDISFFSISTQLLTNVITVLFFCVISVLHKEFTTLTGMGATEIFLLFIYMLLYPAYSSWLVLKRTEYKYKKVVAVTLLYSLLNVVFPLLGLFIVKNTAIVKYNATLIASIVIFVPIYLKNANYYSLLKKIKLVLQQWKFVVLFQAPLVVHGLSYFILTQADHVMIGAMVGEEEVAYYSVAYSVGSTISIFVNSVNQALLPWSYEKLEKGQYNMLKTATKVLMVGMGIIIILFVLVAPEVVKILFAPNYYEAVWSIPPVAISVYFVFLYSLFVNVENYYEYTRYFACVSIVCGIINIILNGLLIGVFGYIVCGYTTAASYFLMCVGHYMGMKKACNREKVSEEVYDVKISAWISIILVAVSPLIMLLYPYMGVRYALLVMVLLVVYKKRVQVREIINELKGGGEISVI